VDSAALTSDARLARGRGRPALDTADAGFWVGVAGAVALGAAVRFTYLFHGAPEVVHSDGFLYHYEALRLADGLGYTAGGGVEVATHPPGWVTLLAVVSEAGGRSMRTHQLTGLVIGLGVILIAGLVGRRYAGRRVGVIAAFLAASYPGFWVLDVQILSEPLGLALVGLLMLVLADLWERPTLARVVLAGTIAGALILVRSEMLLLLGLVVAPIVLLNRRITVRRRVAWTGAVAVTAVVWIAPWTIHNLGRFEEPVPLSHNVGTTLVNGNCPPETFGGDRIGSYDFRCERALRVQHPDIDQSQKDIEARNVAFENMRDNLERLPATVLARFGRLVAVFRPVQTVGLMASFLGSATWPVWAWVTAFWVIAPLAAYGSVLMRRAGRFQWPLVAPLLIIVLGTTIAFGDPRHHTPADLGILVLAAVALDHGFRRCTKWA
jgi:Dolichyl-phosphate-mannose-protein mannosyltransferase